MDVVERLRSWSYRRQLLGRAASEPLQALGAVVGVYSTHPTAPLALLARCAALSREQFQALEQRREVVRIIGMRGSAFMVPTELASRVLAATRAGPDQFNSLIRARGLDLETYTRLTPVVLECCSEPMTPGQLRACAKTDEDVYMVARVLARQGRILRVGASLRTDQLKYVATRSWLGSELPELDRAEALAWLAGEYLRAYGPARVADFAWWSGANRRAAVAACAAHDTVGQDGLVLRREDAAEFARSLPIDREAVDVLPKWDSYTMGYAPDGRQRFIDDQYLPLAYTSVTGSPGATSGDGLPLVLRRGRTVGTWSHRFDGHKLNVTVCPFEGERISDRAFEAVGELLSASKIIVTTATETATAR